MAYNNRSEEPMVTCGNAEQLLRSVDVLPGHASAIQATRGDGIGRLGGESSKQFWQVHNTAEGRVPPATCPGPQANKTATMERVARAVSLF